MPGWLRRNGFRKGGFRRRDILRLLGTGCAVTVAVVLTLVLRPGLFGHMESKTYDVLLAQTRQRPPSPVPVLIAIDDKSLSRLGQWPWPRHVLARLVNRLHEAGAGLVALDLLLSDRDRTSPISVLESLDKKTGLDLHLGSLAPETFDYDRVLARELRNEPSVLGFKLLFFPLQGAQTVCRMGPLLPASSVPAVFNLHTAHDAICSLPILGEAALASGFVNALPDADGVIRRVPLVAVAGENLVPSLALATAKASAGSDLTLGSDMDGGFLQLDQNRCHIDTQGNMLVRFRGARGTFATYSISDILEGSLPDLHGRVAIVGPTAAGLGDNHVVPLDRFFPGIEIHATVLDNLLQQDFLVRPVWAPGAEVFAVMAVGLMSSLLMMVAGPLTCLAGFAGGALGLWSASLWLLDGPGYWLSPLGAELVLVLNMAALSLIKYGMEERELRIRSQQLLQAQDATILSLTALAETRDPETGGHIKRTREYVLVLARSLARKPHFRKRLDRDTIDLLYKSAPLHDIGKVGIADSILLKPGRLSEEEWEQMQKHTILGAETLAEAERQTANLSDRSYLALAREIAISHHERWDGSGYPYGLAGEEIPLGGRLMALADVYDALITKRVYKDAFAHEDAKELIRNGRGTHFDPEVVDAFLESEALFREISRKYT